MSRAAAMVAETALVEATLSAKATVMKVLETVIVTTEATAVEKAKVTAIAREAAMVPVKDTVLAMKMELPVDTLTALLTDVALLMDMDTATGLTMNKRSTSYGASLSYGLGYGYGAGFGDDEGYGSGKSCGSGYSCHPKEFSKMMQHSHLAHLLRLKPQS